MASGSWDHSQTLGLFGMPILVLPFILMLPNSGVCLFHQNRKSCSNPLHPELAKGGKRVAWKSIKAQNTWYISKTFLLSRRTFDNPTRLAESDLRAYWEHWFNQSESGHEFTFRRVGAPIRNNDLESGSESSNQDEDENEDKEDKSKGKGKNREDEEEEVDKSGRKGGGGESDDGEESIGVTPDQCHTDEEKFTFLRSLLPRKKEYQAVVDILAQMKVSWHYCFIYIPS